MNEQNSASGRRARRALFWSLLLLASVIFLAVCGALIYGVVWLSVAIVDAVNRDPITALLGALVGIIIGPVVFGIPISHIDRKVTRGLIRVDKSGREIGPFTATSTDESSPLSRMSPSHLGLWLSITATIGAIFGVLCHEELFPARASARAALVNAREELRGLRVLLLAYDNDRAAENLRSQLEKWGAVVTLADSNLNAARLLDAQKFDLMIEARLDEGRECIQTHVIPCCALVPYEARHVAEKQGFTNVVFDFDVGPSVYDQLANFYLPNSSADFNE